MADPVVRNGATRRAALLLAVAGIARLPAARLASLACLAGTRAAQAGAPEVVAVREVDLTDFAKMVLEVPAQVDIVLGERNHARIEAERRVLDSIEFRSSNGTLRVAAARSFQTRHAIRIRITCRRLVSLDARSSVDATLAGLSGERFSLSASDSATVSLAALNLAVLHADIAGSATVTAAGKARTQRVRAGGAGTYDAGELESLAAVVDASGSSDVVIDSRDSLEANVSGAATVQYEGDPTLKQAVEGAGTLERR